MKNTRRTAAFIFSRWLITKDFPQTMLPDSGSDRAFVQDLVYTAIRRFRPLRKVLSQLVTKWPKGELQSLLFMGAAQILYMKDVPDFAAVNETVDAAKGCENPAIAKVVNGVLRNLIRRREEFENLLSSATVEEREGYPSELYRRWVNRFGAEVAEKLAIWHNAPAETFLAYPDRFEKLGRGKKVTDVAGYENGEFIVQDPGTALAIELLDVRKGEKVLDACAAPGGKTVQILWRGGEVTACEVNPKRRRKLEENLKRLRLEAKIIGDLHAVEAGSFMKVLVDAPCSNTGVLRRRPDARWNWSMEKLAELVKLQAVILDVAALAVAPGGVLVYSTCSNEPEENELQIEAFLKAHPEFRLEKKKESVPCLSGMDGAFACSLIRN
jgi:16S rRNA (cytosine967-C5)-methyltransferase